MKTARTKQSKSQKWLRARAMLTQLSKSFTGGLPPPDSRFMKTTPTREVSGMTNEPRLAARFVSCGVASEKISIFAERSFSELGK